MSLSRRATLTDDGSSSSIHSGRSETDAKDNDANPANNDQADVPKPEDILSQSLSLTNLIFGIYAIELWHYDEQSGKLINVGLGSQDEETGQRDAGLLLKRETQETDLDNDYSTSEAIDAFGKLTDRSRSDHLPASPVDPGVGLPGVLWAESSSAVHLGVGVRQRQAHHDGINWRDVVELANDPDQVSYVLTYIDCNIIELDSHSSSLLCISAI